MFLYKNDIESRVDHFIQSSKSTKLMRLTFLFLFIGINRICVILGSLPRLVGLQASHKKKINQAHQKQLKAMMFEQTMFALRVRCEFY